MNAAARTGADQARLMCRTGEFAGITVDVRDAVTVGRQNDNDVVVDSLLLSRRHARIYRDENGWWVEDLDSRNGTRVDGTAVEGVARLQGLNVISFADAADFVFVQAPGSAPAAGTADAARERQATMLDMSGFAMPDIDREGRDERQDEPGGGSGPATRMDRAGFSMPDLEDESARPAASGKDTAEPGGTMLDMSGFGAVPELGEEDGGDAASEAPPADAGGAGKDASAEDAADAPGKDAPGKDAPGKDAPRKDEPEPGGTMLDMSGFGAMPSLGDDQAGEDAADAQPPEDDAPAAGTAPEEPAPTGDAPGPRPGERPEEADGEEPAEAGDEPVRGGTMLNMSGFAMPDLDAPAGTGAREPDPDATQPPPDASGTTHPPRGEARAEPTEPRVRVALLADLPGDPVTFELHAGDNVIGRASVCDIVLPDPDKVLSRRHAVVRVEGDEVTLVDLDSANGTWVDDEKIEEASLEPGGTFKLGPYLQFTVVST